MSGLANTDGQTTEEKLLLLQDEFSEELRAVVIRPGRLETLLAGVVEGVSEAVQVVPAAVLRGLSGAWTRETVLDIVQQVLGPEVSVRDLQETEGGTQTSHTEVVEADLQTIDHRQQHL